jgi:membrane protease YdiL (CAAX protease family)
VRPGGPAELVKPCANAADDPAVRTSAAKLSRERRWPPRAERRGADLSVGAVLVIVVLLEMLTYGARANLIGPSTTAGEFIRFLAADVATVLVWLVLVGVIDWTTVVGLRNGRLSAWGVVPLAYLWVATILSAGVAGRLAATPGVLPWLIASVVIAAFQEEIAFRGFLLQGLTRKIGGSAAVVVSSTLFALYHVPKHMREDQASDAIVALLIAHFVFGVLMCRVRAETGSLWLPTAVHAVWNVLIITYWTVPVGDPPASARAMMQMFVLVSLAGAIAFIMHAVVGRSLRDVWARALAELRQGGSVARSGAPAEFFERFDDASRRAIVRSEMDARMRGDDRVRTGHLVHGIMLEADESTRNLLRTLGAATRPSLEPDQWAVQLAQSRPIRFTSASKRALVQGYVAADEIGSSMVEPAHLYLGVIRQARVARDLDGICVDADDADRSVVRFLLARAEAEGPRGEPTADTADGETQTAEAGTVEP